MVPKACFYLLQFVFQRVVALVKANDAGDEDLVLGVSGKVLSTSLHPFWAYTDGLSRSLIVVSFWSLLRGTRDHRHDARPPRHRAFHTAGFKQHKYSWETIPV